MIKHALMPLTGFFAISFSFTGTALAADFTVDFETAGTGKDLKSSSLTTPLGEISLDCSVSTASDCFIATGATGNTFLESIGDVVLTFDFDVSELSFVYAGAGGGRFYAEALDINGNVVDFLYDPVTEFAFASTNFIDGTATLGGFGGTNIRALRFGDLASDGTVDNEFAADLDNLKITAAPAESVPEPASMLGLLTVGAVAASGALKRKRSAEA